MVFLQMYVSMDTLFCTRFALLCAKHYSELVSLLLSRSKHTRVGYASLFKGSSSFVLCNTLFSKANWTTDFLNPFVKRSTIFSKVPIRLLERVMCGYRYLECFVLSLNHIPLFECACLRLIVESNTFVWMCLPKTGSGQVRKWLTKYQRSHHIVLLHAFLSSSTEIQCNVTNFTSMYLWYNYHWHDLKVSNSCQQYSLNI